MKWSKNHTFGNFQINMWALNVKVRRRGGSGSWRPAKRRARMRRGVKKGGGGRGTHPERGGRGPRKHWSRHGRQFLPEGSFMMSIPVPTLCASV